MAAPAVALAVKAAVAAATDKRTWKVIAVTITAVLMPFILAVLLLMSFLSGGAAHNNDAVNLAFHGGTISSDVPSEYRQHIEEMQDAFSQLDDAIAQLHIESGDGSLDSTRVKAVFYSLYFGADSLQGWTTIRLPAALQKRKPAPALFRIRMEPILNRAMTQLFR